MNEENVANKGMEYESILSVLRVRWDDFMVHFDTTRHILNFEVYPVSDWEKLGTGEKGMSYYDKEEGINKMHDQFEYDTCLKKLEGSICWCGVWESRLCFPDEEYWGEEIEELSRLYNDFIVPWCKDFIEKRKSYKTKEGK